MKLLAVTLVVFSSSPVFAEETKPVPEPDSFTEFTETLRDLFGDFAQDIAPMFENFGNQIKGLGLYEAPEVLPNGDIIIRRKPDAPREKPGDQEGTVDL